MIRIEIDQIDDITDGIKHFEMKGIHEKVIEECGVDRSREPPGKGKGCTAAALSLFTGGT